MGETSILSGKSPLCALVAGLIVFLTVMSLSLVPIRADNDAWWHIKSGKVLAEQGLPKHDVLAYTAADYEWHNHEWLAQLSAWHVYRIGERTTLGGWRSVIVATGVINAAAFLVLLALAGRLSDNWWIALLVILIAAGLGRRMYVPRPPAFTNLFLAIQLLVLVGVHEGWFRRRRLALLPVLFAFWANIHGGWLAGLVVLGAFFVQDTATAVRSWIPLPFEDAPRAIPLAKWAILLPACLIGTLFNPYLWQLYELPFRVLSEHTLVQNIGELLPPDLKYVRDFIHFVLATILFLAVSRGRRVRLANVAIFLFFLLQAFQHVRHLVLLGVVMVPFWSRLADGAFRELATVLQECALGLSSRTIHAVVGIVALVGALGHGAFVLRNAPESDSYLTRNREWLQNRDGYVRRAFPAEAADFIQLVGFEGPLYNENNFAGYLIWRFSPEQHQVFSDSRFDIFGADLFWLEEIVAGVYEGDDERPSWREVLDDWNVQWGITRGRTPLARALRQGLDGWAVAADFGRLSREVSPDFVLFVRDTPENAAMLQRARRIFETTYGAAARPAAGNRP
jgi:hypothetical protein